MSTAIFSSYSEEKLNLLIQLAKELGISAKKIQSENSTEKIPFAAISESSLAEEWLSEEDNRWDKFYKK